MDIDGQETERFDIRLAPNPAATIEQEALDVAGVTLEQVQSYQPMEEGYRQLVGILSKYVNKFDKRDKMYLVGYNNAGFDNNFLRATRISLRIRLALHAYICMIMIGRKDTGKYVALFGKCVTIM